MERTTVDFGIDLGTTNSVISVSQGGNIETIKNGLSEITPSVVYMDKRGVVMWNKVMHLLGQPTLA